MMDDLSLNMNAFLPLRDVVFHTLREAILKGELKPGERLMELQLASKLGVSRTPIREAIRMLEQEGLAITTPRKGAEVAKMTEKDMEDVLRIRENLEGLAIELACEEMTKEQLVQLEKAGEAFEAALKSEDLKLIAETDVAFHDVIYDAANNPKLVVLLNNLREQMYRYRVEYLKNPTNYPTVVEEHKEILAAIKVKNKEKACDAMVRHVNNQAEIVKELIRKQ